MLYWKADEFMTLDKEVLQKLEALKQKIKEDKGRENRLVGKAKQDREKNYLMFPTEKLVVVPKRNFGTLQ